MNDMANATPPDNIPAGAIAERVTLVEHYTDRLFRFRTTRAPTLRFRSGEFIMIGLPNAEKPVMRAYSIASPAWDEELEFYSIKVKDGPLTEHLQKIKVGDWVIMRPKVTGTLVNDALIPGKRLFCVCTGTGFAPFSSLVRDPETYEKFENIYVTHSCRLVAELTYGQKICQETLDDPLVGEVAQGHLTYYGSATREPFEHTGRSTDLITSGKLAEDLGIPQINPETDRVMICGSIALNKDMKAILEERGFVEGSNNQPGTYVVERAFVG